MEADRMDLTPLDATADPQRADRLVRAVLLAAQPELQRRAEPTDVLDVFADWARPLLAAAAILTLASAVALSRGSASPEGEAAPVISAAAAVVPASVASWIEEDRAPATDDLLLAMEERP